MTEEQILQAFNGRWRIKGFDEFEVRQLSGKSVKDVCLDFFRTGILLAEGSAVSGLPADTPPSLVSQPPGKTLFDVWWDLYGKKIDRAKCERKFNKLTPAEQQACIAATPAYVASTPDLQFRRHPATYLNNKSWENQIIPRNNATNAKPSIEQQRLSKLADIITG
jgi:hypothetical protein